MTKEILYYTNNKLDERIFQKVQEQLLKTNLPIVSVSLESIDFGKNIVLPLKSGMVTVTKQILAGIEASEADVLFFAECDILYPKEHFEFIPQRQDTFYYDDNIIRWDFPKNRFISYDSQVALYCLCAYRELLLKHYTQKLNYILEQAFDNHEGDCGWMRRIGHEPGKKKKVGGLSNDPRELWTGKYSVIDIRHNKTMTKRQVNVSEFRHPPVNFKETKAEDLRGWNLKEMFNFL